MAPGKIEYLEGLSGDPKEGRGYLMFFILNLDNCQDNCLEGKAGMTKQDVLYIEDISNILRVSSNTIQRKSWREKTGCPIRKKGKRLFSLVAEFHNWMKS